jgi:hypothetical protein
MAEQTPDPRRKVTLEQIIHLKRSERPGAEFWEGFDRELHRRQLVALVTIDPWHRRALRALTTLARRLAPASAGAAALAFAAIAIMRMGTPSAAPDGAVATVAATEVETKVVLLPEESIFVSTMRAPRSQPAAEQFHGNVRSAPQELASGLGSSRRFVAVSAPVTFSSGGDSSAIYSANALTAGSVLRSLTAAVPESL